MSNAKNLAEYTARSFTFVQDDKTESIDPAHPRAVRSGMGCIEVMEWRRLPLEELPCDLPVFVLETGGTPLKDFVFPRQGIVIIGSEELGVSPAALERATYGRVTIPMKGMKASLNVGVAFGILMQAWVGAVETGFPDSGSLSE